MSISDRKIAGYIVTAVGAATLSVLGGTYFLLERAVDVQLPDPITSIEIVEGTENSRYGLAWDKDGDGNLDINEEVVAPTREYLDFFKDPVDFIRKHKKD